LASAGSAPLSFVFVLGGIGMAADAGFDLAHKQWDDKVQEKFKMKANNETYPRVLYPIARGYFDALNTIEFSNMLKTETDEMEYAKIYIRSSVLAGQEKEKLKVCTSDAKLNGVSRGERKDIEKNLMDILMGMDEQRSLSAVDQAKKDYAECLMAIQSDVDESFPVADMLLAKIELQGKNLINRKMKGVVRNYNYVYKIAKAQGRDISIDDYFTKVSELNESQAICSSHKRPLKRRKLAEQILK